VSHVPLHGVFREHVAGVEGAWSGNPRGLERIENAHRMDQEFLAPVAFLAAVHIIRFEYDRAAPYLDHLRRRSDRLTRFESLYLAVLDSWYARSPGSGLRAARELQEIAPTCLTCRHLRARLAFALNRPGEVVETIAPTMEHIPRPFGWLRNRSQRFLRRAYDRLGEYQPLLELARQMRREDPGETSAFASETVALVGLGRFEELDELVEECASFPGGECDVIYVLFRAGALLAAREEHERSVRYGERSVELLRSLPEEDLLERQFDYLNALRMAESWDEYADFARDTADRLQDNDPLHWYASTCVGMAAAHHGEAETARVILDQLLAREEFAFSAYVAAYLGELDDAVDYLKESLEQEREITSEHFVRWDPDLAPLWGYLPFEELIEPKG
jgi:tetratricopeptide (TPR) repeat protein